VKDLGQSSSSEVLAAMNDLTAAVAR
jgi:hypothetical protein